MPNTARDVLLVGSMPLRPASRVFETVARHLGTLAPRIPDGEQSGWVRAVWRTLEQHPALEVGQRVPLNSRSTALVNIYRLRTGCTSEDLRLGPYGYADNALASYEDFRRLKGEGDIRTGTRFQVTMPGPGTGASAIQMPGSELLPIARAALWDEIEQILAKIPADDLTLQLDIGMEAEHEEYLRNPTAFNQPIHHVIDWTHAQMADSVAWLGNRVPPDVELGFHICSI
jgi:hypothetical protein